MAQANATIMSKERLCLKVFRITRYQLFGRMTNGRIFKLAYPGQTVQLSSLMLDCIQLLPKFI